MNAWAKQAWQQADAALREFGKAVGGAALKADVKEALGSLRVNKQRSLLALVGIVVGIGSVTAMISIGMVAKAETAQRFRELGIDTLIIRKRGAPAEGHAPAALRLPDVRALPVEVASIAAATPSFQLFSTLSHAGESLQQTAIMGATASFAELNKLSLQAGRFISDLDVHRYYCVVGWEIAEAMRHAGAKRLVGETLTLAGRLYTVVGVLQKAPVSGMGSFDADRSAFVPITTGLRTLPGAEIQFIVARRQPDSEHRAVAAAVQDYFLRKAGLSVRVHSAEQLIAQMQKQMRLFTLLLAAVGSIALIVGGVGVMNVMLASVTERRREIGVRRALGARRRDIQNQFLIESVILALLGGGLGVALGMAAAYAICLFSGWAFLASPAAMALGVGVASAVGVFFGFHPAYQAARLDPIAAMRAE